MAGRAVAAVAATALVLSACSRSADTEDVSPPTRRPAVAEGSALTFTFSGVRIGPAKAPPESSIVFSAEIAVASDDLTITAIEPVEASGVEIVAYGLNWIRGGEGKGLGTYPTLDCTREWDGKGLGRSVPAKGSAIGSGDEVSFNVYARIPAAGAWRARGLVVDYEIDKKRFRQTSETFETFGTADANAEGCHGISEWYTPPTSGK